MDRKLRDAVGPTTSSIPINPRQARASVSGPQRGDCYRAAGNLRRDSNL